MAEPFLGEVKIISFNFPPKGWAFCDGQLLAINQNQALFAILGTTYGGNGQNNFALPNLQGRVPVHASGGQVILGELGGEQAHTLIISELPAHTHAPGADNNTVNSGTVAGHIFGMKAGTNLYSTAQPDTAMNTTGSVGNVGGNQPHNNMQPYLVLNFIIALQGIFPSRN
jgi:microcystin-dependent protein